MSSPYSTWFQEGIDTGTLITLDQPIPSQWKILEKLNEHDYQVNKEENDESGFISFASAKLLCCDPKTSSKQAFMRIYIQVPHRKTEMHNATTRGRQATTFTPPELSTFLDLAQKRSDNTPTLLGYKIGTQDQSGLVPGGFVTWLVWQIIPGLRLGDCNGADPFWALERREREHIRVAFLKTLPKLVENGWYPEPAAKSLVWQQETQTLFFIGEFEKAQPKRPVEFGAERIADFELAQPDPSYRRGRKGWDKDTSRWRW